MKKTLKTLAMWLGMFMPICLLALGMQESTYPFEDAAYQAVQQLNADKKVTDSVKNIAFVKIFAKEGTVALGSAENEAIVFEAALAAAPGKLNFVLHSEHEADWKLLDEIFRQARDLSSWDPKSHPELNKLTLCDAILVGHLVSFIHDERANTLTARIALRLIQVATGEEIWARIIEGKYSDGGPDNEQVSLNWRRALEACAADAVKKLPPTLEDYGVLLLPIEGTSGKAMGQVFLNALTAAGLQDKITVYDLPNGNAQDRLFAKFLSERAAEGVQDEDFLKRSVGQFAVSRKLPSKLAILSGMVSVVNENPVSELTADGLPIDFLGGEAATVAQARKSYEVITDFKFRDVNDAFRVIASVGATGIYMPPAEAQSGFDKAENMLDQFFSFAESGSVMKMFKILLAVVVLFVLLKFIHGIITKASRPR